jgi:hypothetical protein
MGYSPPVPEAILDTFRNLPFDKLLKLADAEAISKVSPLAYDDAWFRNERLTVRLVARCLMAQRLAELGRVLKPFASIASRP